MADVTQSAAAPLPDMPAGVAFAGRYRIAELLGEGDRKRTYLALDTNLERKVALSLIKAEAARPDLDDSDVVDLLSDLRLPDSGVDGAGTSP